VSAAQFVHVLAAPAAYVPVVQFVQGPVAPTKAEYLPAMHELHSL
jgi:hypothetical protein